MIAPLNATVCLRGDIQRHQQDYASVLTDSTTSIEYMPTYGALANRGLLYASANQFPQALDDLNQVMTFDGSSPALLIYRGAIKSALEVPLAAAR